MAASAVFTGPVQAARDTAGRLRGPKSGDAAGLLDFLLRTPAPARRQVLAQLEQKELRYLLVESDREYGTAFRLWRDTPSGFVEDVLGETIWSRQRQILDSVWGHKRTVVPAGFGVGKTHISARSVVHFVNVDPVGSSLAVTTATRFRQVRYQLWPHIRRTVARAGLPGACDTTQYKIPDVHGNDVVVAYGFSAPDNDEAAMQGIHAQRLLLVVDEAGGISRMIGGGTNNLLTGDARMLAIGNPAMNDPRSWFEEMVEEGLDPEEPSTVTITIPTLISPAITGERTPVCRDCVPNIDGHTVAKHMPDQDWVDRTIRDYGSKDHPYVIAKVFAEFPKDAGSQTIPTTWVEVACDREDPEPDDDWVRLCDLGLGTEDVDDDAFEDSSSLPAETATFTVKRGSWVRLGVDIAADGGDEFSIDRCVGDVVHPLHRSSGVQNKSQVDVAEVILAHILAAERLAAAIGSTRPVRVKVDKNGLGHGAVGMLERWRKMGRHHAEIVGVMVSETPERDDPAAPLQPKRKRDELWISMRQLLELDPSTGVGRLRLRVDRKTRVQLSTPRLGYDAGGLAVVESKDSMRKRGVDSPDRAESSCLAVYEPFPLLAHTRRGLLNGG